ncbi:sugar O-acyltransferase, sialic acid O-acetyltransferase NeuD family [Pseudarcicella hirudinis]|uniref:Sugar O-acyltransferase, sialic acid O-acetyltransferase NeuD family n=1 Tax=Pseudarcicella hirudinis TaxID=1079859 RepID=A0A1I5WRX4_9BACT|nr:NeuD/PglB/VioB family sugar acetyltransferase [Pseudarcicella hirudinis]SFQ22489.1 sugar O-acyltransferase, sialic acid O-acetyltransferase NeuD family [Pseudarcicella hirudinis]
MENPVIIFGAGSLGAVALDIFKRNSVVTYCFLDDDEKMHNTEIDDVIVMGSTDDEGFTKLIGKKCEAFIAIDDIKVRKNLVEMLNDRRKVQPVNAVHDSTIIASTAGIGHGNLISAGSIINARANIGNHCLIHSKVLIDADTKISDFVQIGAGSSIGTSVEIGEGTFIGSGVTIVSGVKIGKGARIGAGSVVIENIAAKETVFGNPAKKI